MKTNSPSEEILESVRRLRERIKDVVFEAEDLANELETFDQTFQERIAELENRARDNKRAGREKEKLLASVKVELQKVLNTISDD